MDNQAYQQRVQALAEKMAKDKWDNDPFRKGEDFYRTEKNIQTDWINDEINGARIAVAEMAAELKPCLEALATYTLLDVEKVLKQRGLIPDNGQENDQTLEQLRRRFNNLDQENNKDGSIH